MYYTVIKHDRTGPCFLRFSSVLKCPECFSQCNARLRLLHLLYDIARDNVEKLKTIKHAFSMFYTRIKHGFSKNQSARTGPSISLEIVFTIAAPAFDILFIGCVY